MNLDPGQISQMLNMIPYPISKTQLIDMAKQNGLNDQVVSMLDRLPDKTYNSAQDLQNEFGGFGNLGGFKM